MLRQLNFLVIESKSCRERGRIESLRKLNDFDSSFAWDRVLVADGIIEYKS